MLISERFNGVSLSSLEKLSAQGIHTYGQVVEGLLSQGVQPKIETPRHLVRLLGPFSLSLLAIDYLLSSKDGTSSMPDMWLVVVSPSDDPVRLAEVLKMPSDAKVIVLVTKM